MNFFKYRGKRKFDKVSNVSKFDTSCLVSLAQQLELELWRVSPVANKHRNNMFTVQHNPILDYILKIK